jgi:hypothetical protein
VSWLVGVDPHHAYWLGALVTALASFFSGLGIRAWEDWRERRLEQVDRERIAERLAAL